MALFFVLLCLFCLWCGATAENVTLGIKLSKGAQVDVASLETSSTHFTSLKKHLMDLFGSDLSASQVPWIRYLSGSFLKSKMNSKAATNEFALQPTSGISFNQERYTATYCGTMSTNSMNHLANLNFSVDESDLYYLELMTIDALLVENNPFPVIRSVDYQDLEQVMFVQGITHSDSLALEVYDEFCSNTLMRSPNAKIAVSFFLSDMRSTISEFPLRTRLDNWNLEMSPTHEREVADTATGMNWDNCPRFAPSFFPVMMKNGGGLDVTLSAGTEACIILSKSAYEIRQHFPLLFFSIGLYSNASQSITITVVVHFGKGNSSNPTPIASHTLKSIVTLTKSQSEYLGSTSMVFNVPYGANSLFAEMIIPAGGGVTIRDPIFVLTSVNPTKVPQADPPTPPEPKSSEEEDQPSPTYNWKPKKHSSSKWKPKEQSPYRRKPREDSPFTYSNPKKSVSNIGAARSTSRRVVQQQSSSVSTIKIVAIIVSVVVVLGIVLFIVKKKCMSRPRAALAPQLELLYV